MITINFTPTFANLKQFQDKYNEQFLNTVPSNYGKVDNPDPDKECLRNDVKFMLRPNHTNVMHHLVKIFCAQINQAQALHGPYQYLPAVRVNNGSIASALNMTKKTVSNLLDRLGEAGFILARRFRGSTHDYELRLNVSLFSIAKKGLPAIPVGDDNEVFDEYEYFHGKASLKRHVKEPRLSDKLSDNNGYLSDNLSDSYLNTNNISDKLSVNLSANLTDNNVVNIPPVDSDQNNDFINNFTQKSSNVNSGFEEKEQKKFPHKDEDDILNKDNNGCGEIEKKISISELFFLFKGDTPNQKSSDAKKIPSAPDTLPDQKKKETTPVAPAPLKTQNTTLPGAAPHKKYIVFLHNLMYSTIFSRQQYHAPTQVEAAKNYLRSQFEKLDDRQAKAKFIELKIRVILAFNWIKKGDIQKKDGTTQWTRFIPVPATYLNPLNFASGFVNTLIWHDKFIEDRRNRKKLSEINDQIAIFYEQWDLLTRAVDFYLKENDYHSYQKAKNYLRKKSPELVYAFDKMVLRNQYKISA